jgi:predicted MFS family arabinose efflux permease
VALLNILFHAGIFITPLIGGWVMEKFSPGTYLVMLFVLAFSAAAAMTRVEN